MNALTKSKSGNGGTSGRRPASVSSPAKSAMSMLLDADSKKGWDALNKYLPDTFLTPAARSPKGAHIYFEYKTGLSNGVRVLTDCDLRTTGGYIIAPPSSNGKGEKYYWPYGCSIREVKPAPMPDVLFDILQSGAVQADALTSANKNKGINPYIKTSSSIGDNICEKTPLTTNRQHLTTSDNIGFDKGQRDQTLYHLVWPLHKSGMPVENIEIFADFFARNCSPPFNKKETAIKIKSALDRSERQKKGLTEEIREMIVTTSCNISTTFVYNRQQVTTREDKKKVAVILNRLAKEGLLKPTCVRAGEYRIVDSQCEPQQWQDADTSSVDVWLPFELDQTAELQPGNISVIAGTKDSGKTAVLLNVAKENLTKYQVHYFSSEMGKAEFMKRVDLFPYTTAKQLEIKFYERADNFADVIKGGEGNLNVIDF